MANILKQVVVQDNVEGINKRFLIQYYNDETNETLQVIVDYDSLTVEEKLIYDNFISLRISKL